MQYILIDYGGGVPQEYIMIMGVSLRNLNVVSNKLIIHYIDRNALHVP